MMHIKQTLPDIKARINNSLQKYSTELSGLGDSILGNSANIVLNIITEFSNEYRTVLDGNNQELSSTELSGGARISFVFHELYSNGVKSVDPFDQVKDIDIRTILYNSSGSSPALFVGTTAFELIVKQQIKRLEEPSLKCVSLVYDELVRILTQLLQKQVSTAVDMCTLASTLMSVLAFPKIPAAQGEIPHDCYRILQEGHESDEQARSGSCLDGSLLHQHRTPRLSQWT